MNGLKGKICILLCLLIAQPLSHAAESDFPGRKLYLAVPYIELEQLYQQRDKLVFVDVRSPYEYQTLRIKGAINIPLSDAEFVQKIQSLRKRVRDKAIVVYCNGKTCMKSYKAVSKCRKFKIDNVIAYDAGIIDWARKYPEESILLGKMLSDPKKLISKKRFTEHLLLPDEFEGKVSAKDVIVLDVRDRFQREGISLFIKQERRALLDQQELVDRFIVQAKRENKTLLVYDQAGKQVRWLMYRLEDQGLPSYYFMKGGARDYYQNLRQQFVR